MSKEIIEIRDDAGKVIRRRVIHLNEKPSLTEQSHKQMVNVNNIIKNYTKTGAIPHTKNIQPQYGEVNVTSFQQAMDMVVTAQQNFDQLPAETRKIVGNSPQAMVDFCQDPNNKEMLVKMGLAEEIEVKPPKSTAGKASKSGDNQKPVQDTSDEK